MKNVLKFLKKLFSNFWFKLVALLAVIVAIFAISGAFNSPENMGGKILELITSVDTLSIFLAAALSIIVATVASRLVHRLEESLKIEDDHHKIIVQYWDHVEPKKNARGVTPEADIMYLTATPSKRKKIKNCESDVYSKTYVKRQKDIDAYVNEGKLYLPSINVYANIDGNAQVKFEDSADKFELPKFVHDNALKFMEAHRGSNVSNGATIRLNDAVIDGNEITLKTGRSQYFDMLITNRCMDYAINDSMTLRDVYESGPAVSPLSESQLGNQIGINGLIFSNDGYLLVEKRGFRKTTWKNKFAQPISLAMKKSEIELFDADGKIAQDAETVFKKIVLDTVNNNFGLADDDVVPFKLSQNLFGIARDLLEGGKPNVYFYVTVDKSAKELAELLQKKAAEASKKKAPSYPKLTKDKLDSDYYLIKYSDVKINYKYELKVKARDVIRVKRKYAPRVRKLSAAMDGSTYRAKRRFNGSIKRECGEAFLACLYYADVCEDRLGL